jgi:carbon-monoxide dehydrogenase medium subunit
MILPRFDVLVPETVAEACSMLAAHAGEGVRVLAGGTDLLVDLRRPIIPAHVPRCDGCPTHPEGRVYTTVECAPRSSDQLMAPGGSLRAALEEPRHAVPAVLVSLHKIEELRGIRREDDGSLRLGALTTITEIERSEPVRRDWTALAEGADNLGSPLVRNRGTLGGNIANARPAADTAVPTIGLGGQLAITGPSASRTIAAADFPRGPGLSVLQADEIITAVHLPAPSEHQGSAYYKLAARKALEIATVGVAIWVSLKTPDGPIADARIALGAVGPTPLLAESARQELLAKTPDENVIAQAAKAAVSDARPIDDHRGSAWYRLRMVELLTKRLLNIAIDRARGKA